MAMRPLDVACASDPSDILECRHDSDGGPSRLYTPYCGFIHLNANKARQLAAWLNECADKMDASGASDDTTETA